MDNGPEITYVNTRWQSSRHIVQWARALAAIQLQLGLPLCLLPLVLLRQPELLRIFILHLHCTFPLLFSYFILIFYLLFSLLYLLASLDLLLLLPCLVLLTLVLLFSSSSSWFSSLDSGNSPLPIPSSLRFPLTLQTFCLGTLQMLQISCPLLGCTQELAKCKPLT